MSTSQGDCEDTGADDLCLVGLSAAAQAGPVSQAVFRVARLHRLLAGQLIRPFGLHAGQELLMMHLWESGPQRQIDLAHVMDCDAATMTRKVRRLEQSGFVRRVPSTTDRRVVMVEPTPAGLALRERVAQAWGELEKTTLADMDEADRVDAERLLELLERNLCAAVGREPLGS